MSVDANVTPEQPSDSDERPDPVAMPIAGRHCTDHDALVSHHARRGKNLLRHYFDLIIC